MGREKGMLQELKQRGLLGIWYVGNSRALVSTRELGISGRSWDEFLWVRNGISFNVPKERKAEWISMTMWLLERVSIDMTWEAFAWGPDFYWVYYHRSYLKDLQRSQTNILLWQNILYRGTWYVLDEDRWLHFVGMMGLWKWKVKIMPGKIVRFMCACLEEGLVGLWLPSESCYWGEFHCSGK